MGEPNDEDPDRCPRAADGSRLKKGQRVHVVATVIGAAGPLNDLHDTGVVAIAIEGYDNGRAFTTPYHKICVPPTRIAHLEEPSDVSAGPPNGAGSGPVGET